MLLITGATIIDGTGSLPVDGWAVCVEDRRIVAVGPVETLPRGAEVEELCLPGCTLLPGMIDCHVHLVDLWSPEPGEEAPARLHSTLEAARATLEAGFTTVQDLMAPNDVIFAARDAIASGRAEGARIVASGACITIPGGHGCLPGSSLIANDANAVLAAVAEQVRAGADVIKIMVARSPNRPEYLESPAYTVDELGPGVDHAHRAGLRVCAHAHSLPESIRTAVDAGIDSIEHGAPIDDETLGVMSSRGTYLVPTLSVGAGLAATEDTSKLGFAPEIISEMRRLDRQTRDTVRRAHAMGVPVAVGTDAGTDTVPHGANAMELRALVECGFTPLEAIVAGTSHAAVNVGHGHDLGIIEPGRVADLVVVDGDPLSDIGRLGDTQKVLLVIKEGCVAVDRR